MMIVDNKFNIGNIVYVITDSDQCLRIVTAITLRSNNYIEYELSCGTHASYFTEMEISFEKSILT